ncbi:MAG: KTSC domain-containing protein [Chlorobia bacterium]|nr:KTSC domain-containing protein [Fimbriimonadaceae bacterium]
MPKMEPVKSSTIREMGYDEPSQELTLIFVSGDAYVYEVVPPMIYEGLRATSSPGAFFNKWIRDRFEFRHLD